MDCLGVGARHRGPVQPRRAWDLGFARGRACFGFCLGFVPWDLELAAASPSNRGGLGIWDFELARNFGVCSRASVEAPAALDALFFDLGFGFCLGFGALRFGVCSPASLRYYSVRLRWGRTGFDSLFEAQAACRGWFVGLVKIRTKKNKCRSPRSRSRGLIDCDVSG